MNETKSVALCGVPGMKKRDIEKMEKYIKEEYPNIDFRYLGESTLEKEELIDKCKEVEVLISWDQEMDEEIYSKLNLKAYVAASAGFNAANVEAASIYNVVVSNAKGYCKEEVAIHSIMFILDFARRQHLMVPYVEDGNWDLEKAGSIRRFSNSTVGILGLGSIGSTVARFLSGFGVRIIACDPNVSDEKMKEIGVEKVDFDILISEADFLTIHTPLAKETKGIINLDVLKCMKSSAYIVNTARGGIINQNDLYYALTNDIIAGAGLDVLENEPPKESDRKLIELSNVRVTPHSAYISLEASETQLRTTAAEVGRILRNEKPLNLVNPEVLENKN